MKEIICQGCGAIYTINSEQIPATVQCYCQETKFKIKA